MSKEIDFKSMWETLEKEMKDLRRGNRESFRVYTNNNLTFSHGKYKRKSRKTV